MLPSSLASSQSSLGVATVASHVVRGAAYAALSLPSFGVGALPRYGRTLAGSNLARLALALAGRGLLNRSDAISGLPAAVELALAKWLNGLWGGMTHFQFKAVLLDDVFAPFGSCVLEALDALGEEEVRRLSIEGTGCNALEPHVALALTPAEASVVSVQAGVLALEAECEGLGWNALDAIERAGAPFDLYGFGWLRDMVQNTYWGGCPSHQEFLDEWDESAEEYEGVTTDDLDAAAPTKAMACARHIKRAELLKIAAEGSTQARQVAKLLADIRSRQHVKPAFDMHGLASTFEQHYDSPEPSVIVGWSDVKLAMRVGDDYANRAMESGEDMRDWIAVLGLPLTGTTSLQRAELRWKATIGKLRLVDQLLSLIATPC